MQDYRKLEGQYDKIVSIEMFEAVGFDHYDDFFGACDRLLTPDGSMFLQTITLREQEIRDYRKRVDWIQTYIFPGSELASVLEIGRSLVRTGRLQDEGYGEHRAALCEDAFAVAREIFPTAGGRAGAWIRRAVYADVGFLFGVVRRGVSGTVCGCGADCDDEAKGREG